MGILEQLKFLLFSFLPDQFFAKIPATHADLTGRTYVVTGSNTGLGLATAIHLARMNPARLILAVRDLKKGNAAKDEIIAETAFAGLLEVWELDMADFASVKGFVERVDNELERVDGAILNAGINVPSWDVTVDGWEKTRVLFANSKSFPEAHSSHQIPSELPCDCIPGRIAAPDSEKDRPAPASASGCTQNIAASDYHRLWSPYNPPRVRLITHYNPFQAHNPAQVVITQTGFFRQSAHWLALFPEKKAPEILRALNDESKSIKRDRYPTSKLLLILFVRKLAALSAAEGVIVNVADPALCISSIGSEYHLGKFAMFLVRRVAWTTTKGALNLVYAVLKPTPSGAYISYCDVRRTVPWSVSDDGKRVQEKVWNEMVEVWRGVSPDVDDIVKS
ncbi:hypothetical protein MSAN_00664800 [Mycena sanguinolenta]|uniref:NAD(P)-binding protein n=1 Tax=Mycena sanguinolenta TaxID=230812 RepID=A0A8H6Z3K6_9AGAR|nr:hypothetical protein MSAN_00664800 [Mycena sanguinolenta]